MSDRSRSASDEGSGDEIRPHGEDRDSSEESEDDPEEARRIAEGFIVDEDDDDEDGSVNEDPEERRRRRKEEKRKRRRRERRERKQREEELSEDELELINENRGIAGPSSNRPLKRMRRRSGSDGEGEEEREGRKGPNLNDMFADDEDRFDEDEDDMGDFIEEDEEQAPAGETEEERRKRRREEKLKRREKKRLRPDIVDNGAWDELVDVLGDGHEFDWALAGEDGIEVEDDGELAKKTTDLKLEQVFDPSEIKARRLQEEDKTIALLDIPERHQLMNSTLSDNPILALSNDPADNLYPPPDLAAQYAYDKISPRTQYLFCNNQYANFPAPHERHLYAQRPSPRPDLQNLFMSAVSTAIKMMFVQHYEVPYIWHYRRDELSLLENQGASAVQFLERDELWTLYNLGIKFKAVYERVQQIRETWTKIKARKPDAENQYLTQQLLQSTCIMGIESASEGVEWLAYHYASDIRAIREDEGIEPGKLQRRLPEKLVQEDLRVGPIMKLVEAFGIDVSTVAVAFNGSDSALVQPIKDSERAPVDIAGEFSGDGTPFLLPEDALQAAREIIITEMTKDPSLRQQAREFVKECADITVTPTDRGMSVIDEYHTYHTFKFLTSKPARDFADTPQWLHILKAEEEGLITISIDVAEEQMKGFVDALEKCCISVDYGEIATKWNTLRKEICRDTVRKNLVGIGSKWLKEYLRSQAEDFVAERCRMELEFRVNVRPYTSADMDIGDTPSVLAITNGKGEMRDAVIAIFLDDDGTIRTQTKFDNLREEPDRDALKEIIERHKPKVLALGGLSIQTARLRDDIMSILREMAMRHINDNPPVSDAYPSHEEFTEALRMFDERLRPFMTPLIIPSDATARMYRDSDDAEKEFPALPVNARYALALARYVQNPLNAYCKLGRRILDITFMEYHQKLISQEKLLINLERGLVNAVCGMGIELSSCIHDTYQRTMLPFISGLGPRKADALVQAILRATTLLNRGMLVDLNMQNPILGPIIGTNVLGFLSIAQDLDNTILEEQNPEGQVEPLDCTRIHPSDYEFAQKMCQDALDLDSEDVEGLHRSEPVLKLMLDPERARKLGELNLDDFAFNLMSKNEGNKRHILGEIVNELISYRADRRPRFYEPTEWEVVQMFTGETERSISRGMKVSATVRKVLPSRAFCQLESGFDAVLEREFVGQGGAEGVASCDEVLSARQNINAVIIETNPQRFQVKISTRAGDLSQAHSFVQPFVDDPFNSAIRRQQAEDAAAAKKRRSQGKVKRVVNHPNWHVLNSGQAEQLLASQPRGEVVIRPSSKGSDHLALTFKLDEDVFQHVDIQEIDKPNEYSLGRILRIGGKYSFGDLDDVIVNYVKAIMRMLEEAERSEKFRPEAELESFLKNTLLAFPNRSMYGFCLDHDRPGYLRLCFLNKSTKDGGQIQTWPVRLLPGAYALNNAEVPGMNELCNAFKAQYSSRLAEQGAGGKTPGIRAGRTPAQGGRTPGIGGATPFGAGMGRTPIRPGMTPNPYGQAGGYGAPPPGMPIRAAGFGGATPANGPGGYPGGPPLPMNGGMYPPQQGYGMPPPQGYGQGGGQMQGMGAPGGPPGGGGYGMRPPPGPPPGPGQGAGMGMNPERAAMLARQGGRY